MYESPITRITEDIVKDIVKREEDYLVESLYKVGFDIDKEELAKALRYDRTQYEKGFNDGKLSAKPRLIPVTERLPEIDMTFPHSERYLVQYEDGYMDVASWSNVNRFWTDHVTEPHWNCAQFQTVIAWMPLPEPWKGEDDG